MSCNGMVSEGVRRMSSRILQGGGQPQPQPGQQPPMQSGAAMVDEELTTDTVGTIGGELPGSEQATEKEQADKDNVVMAGMTMLFENEETSDQAVEMLKARADNPAQAIADYTMFLMDELDKQSGGTIPEEVILPAAGELLENVSQLANDADVFPVDQAVMSLAMQLLMEPLATAFGGDPAELVEIMQGIDSQTMQQIGEEQELYASKQPPARGGGGQPPAGGQPPTGEQPPTAGI